MCYQYGRKVPKVASGEGGGEGKQILGDKDEFWRKQRILDGVGAYQSNLMQYVSNITFDSVSDSFE